MGLLEYFRLAKPQEKDMWSEKAKALATAEPKASYKQTEYQIYETIWDGEKTTGELGAPLSYMPDYSGLSYRSWQAFTESDLAQILVKATVNWVIGTGLKIQSEPTESIIESEGFAFDKKTFTKQLEDRFRTYAKTNAATYSQMENYNKIQRTAYLNSIVGGDVLCVMRVGKNNLPTIQLIDGIFVQNPRLEERDLIDKRGNEIIHGVERNKETKKHVAYYVLNSDNTFTRIMAEGKNTGREMAFFLYGSEYRIDSVRGMPLLSAVLEKMKKLDRYTEAIVGSAEEAAKVPWVWEHSRDSTGENPDFGKLGEMLGDPNSTTSGESNIIDMTAQTTAVRRTFGKEPYNLPIGASLKKLDSAMEKDQEAFITGNYIYICAALETPYEVALMKYVNSFSSSRMASQSYLTILNIKRQLFNDAFNNKFLNLFLDTQILSDKIKADGYFSAVNKGDVILLQAYRNARFTGPGVPQADPSKEVKAVVAQINSNLLTHDEGIERLGNKSDFDNTIDRLSEENKMIKEKMPDEPTQQE